MIPEELRKSLCDHCAQYPSRRVGLVHVMQRLQEHHGGWLPDEAVREAAEIVGVAETEVEGVATFYNQFYRHPVGRRVILCCDSISCYVCGCDEIRAYIEAKLGIRMGETTPDGEFTLLPVVCLGNCDKAPSLMIGDKLLSCATTQMVDEELERR